MSPSTSIAFSASSIPWYSWSANVTFHILLYTCSSHTSAVPRLYEFCLLSLNLQLLSLPILKIFDSVTRKSFWSPLVKAQPSMPCQLLERCLLYVPNLEYPLAIFMYSIQCKTHNELGSFVANSPARYASMRISEMLLLHSWKRKGVLYSPVSV